MASIHFFRKNKLALTLTLVLALSAWLVTPAFADGETPPPPDEGTTETSTEGTVEETPAPTEEAAATADPVVIETVPLESSADTSTAESLASLPEGTDLIVVNADGETVPLASEEAAEIIAGGDPIWCPTGVAPVPDVTQTICSDTYTSLADLVAGFVPYTNGVIWVQWNTTAAGTIDGAGGWSTAATYSLTIQGGWEGTSGSTALHLADPYTYFTGAGTDRLLIDNWIGSITLKNLVFNSVDDTEGAEYAGLWVETAGTIVVDKVTVNDANNLDVGLVTEAHGAVLDNTSGVGNVTVTNSTFNNNEGFGLVILSHGTVTLKNIYAYSNGFDGLYVNNKDLSSATAGKPVTLTNGSFSDNDQSGLAIESEGAITVSNITADLNANYGAKLDNLTPFTTTAAPVYVNGVNSFNGNEGGIFTAGLYVESKGLIKVSSTTANGNGGSGVWLTNSLSTPFSSGVTISGFVNTNGNGSVGLEIYSTGAVTAANLTANNNNFDGAIILNFYSTTPKNVLITGTNTFNNNGTIGLTVQSEGSITLNSVTANNNGYDSDYEGVSIKNNYFSTQQMAVTFTGYNAFLGNAGGGVVVRSFGVITLNNVTAWNNGFAVPDSTGSGVDLDNDDGLYAKAVAIKGVNIFSENEGLGLFVRSDGAITLSKTTANGNGGYGVVLTNQLSPFSSGVTISSYLIANDNGLAGLVIDSTGAVLAANLTTNGNDAEGTQIDNTYYCPITGCVAKNVTISGTSTFNGNDYEGLVIQSLGTVLLYNLTANNNGFTGDYGGVLIDNSGAVTTLQMAVTLSGVNTFIGNSKTGLDVNSFGVITLNNVTAVNNGNPSSADSVGDGVYLVNTGGLYTKAVNLYGTNLFNGNDGYGLAIASYGTVTVSKVTADSNGIGGALLGNDGSPAQSNITISGYGVFNTNGATGGTGNGLEINSRGVITLANITAQYNMGFGADVFTLGATTSHAVTLTGTNSFNYNGDTGYESGLNVNADGNITVYNITASYNFFSGALLDNDTNWFINPYRLTATPSVPFLTFGSVFVNGFGNFVGNDTGYGLLAWSHGSVTLNRVTANLNGDGVDQSLGEGLMSDAGIRVEAGKDGGTGSVTIVCSSAYGNDDDGLYVEAPGSLTLKGFLAYGNVADEDLSGVVGLVTRTTCP
jgi:hypothetical protein